MKKKCYIYSAIPRKIYELAALYIIIKIHLTIKKAQIV